MTRLGEARREVDQYTSCGVNSASTNHVLIILTYKWSYMTREDERKCFIKTFKGNFHYGEQITSLKSIQPEILKQWLLKIRENKNGDGG